MRDESKPKSTNKQKNNKNLQNTIWSTMKLASDKMCKLGIVRTADRIRMVTLLYTNPDTDNQTSIKLAHEKKALDQYCVY